MVGRSAKPVVCLFARVVSGHYESYVSTIRAALQKRGIATYVTASPAKALITRHPVLIMHLEQTKMWSHALVIGRAIAGRRTGALVFRSREAITGQMIVTRMKRLALRLERLLPQVSMMTILPQDLLPGSRRLFRSWIHDPQLWDLALLSVPPEPPPFCETIRARAAGRPIVVALGVMAEYKGMHMLSTLANDIDFCKRFLLVIAGAQVPETEPLFKDVLGDCIIVNRYIADEELYGLYRIASFIWAVYSPEYDQASGIFGRAVQFGRVPIVREGSLIQNYAAYLGTGVVEVAWRAKPRDVAVRLDHSPAPTGGQSIGEEISTDALVRALVDDRSLVDR